MDPMLGQVLISGLLTGGIYALISMGLTLIFGVTRLVNFAHGELVMLSMFGAYLLSTLFGIDPYIGVIPVALCAFVVGILLERGIIHPMLNASHAAQIFVTMGLSIVLMNLALMAFGTDYRTVRTPYEGTVMYVGAWAIGVSRIVAFGAAVLMMVGLLLFLSRTLLGKAITAVSQDRMAAALMGIDIYRMYTIAFAIGVMFVGVAGSLLTPMYATFPSVGQYFGLTSYVVVVLGGMGNVVGALFGGLLIGVVESLSGYFIAPALKEAIYFLIFVVVLFIKPSGLFGIVGAEEMGIK